MRVIVTRPAAQCPHWVRALEHAGLQAEALPLIDILPAPDPALIGMAWQHLDQRDAVMFVSAPAVAGFFDQDLRPTHAVWPPQTRAWVTGTGTREALLRQGMPSTLIDAPAPDAASWDSESLWDAVSSQVRPGFQALLVRGGGGRDWLAQTLRDAGAHVTTLDSYARRAPVPKPEQLQRAQEAAGDGSLWIFSSTQSLQHLHDWCAHQDWSQARALTTHARIARRAHEMGFGQVINSPPGLPAVVASIKSLA